MKASPDGWPLRLLQHGCPPCTRELEASLVECWPPRLLGAFALSVAASFAAKAAAGAPEFGGVLSLASAGASLPLQVRSMTSPPTGGCCVPGSGTRPWPCVEAVCFGKLLHGGGSVSSAAAPHSPTRMGVWAVLGGSSCGLRQAAWGRLAGCSRPTVARRGLGCGPALRHPACLYEKVYYDQPRLPSNRA